MNILIVGGAGYVGGAVTDILADSNHKVRVYDSLMYEDTYLKAVDFVYGDVRDKKRLLPQLEWADAVVWLAAVVGDGACAINPEISFDINQKAVKWMTKNFKGRIIFMSTCSVYGAREGELTEDSPTNPLSVYASTKLGSEEYLKDKNAVMFRLGTLFGVSDRFSRVRFDLIVNTLTVRAFAHNKITVFGGEQFRPLLHVRDAAQAVVDNLITKETGIFNLHRQNVRIIDLAYQVRNHFPDLEVVTQEMSFEDSRNYRANSNKARTVLGFKPKWSIDQGIEELKKILEEHRIKNINDPRYVNDGFLKAFDYRLMTDDKIK